MARRRTAGAAIPVALEHGADGWRLLRGGEPYFVRGAGGSASLVELAAAGGNSVRTWNADELGERLDAAHALGLTVTVGLWLGHERHGFDYGDEPAVRRQFEGARESVLRYRDHPAVLMWGIGNEMEGFGDGDNPLVWNAVNDIAAMIKRLDPAHPTMTVTAEIGGARIDAVHERCPDIDIHGINAYGGAQSLPERLRANGASKPCVLTEFGPPGPWEVATTDWGAPFEMTSTQKAAFYRQTYERAVTSAPGLMLGSYAFLWGDKMEGTATWFGLFLDDGSPTGVVDAMTELWSGAAPAKLAPRSEPLVADGPTRVWPGEEIRIRAGVADPQGGALRTHWALRREACDYATGGDFRPPLPDIDGAVLVSGADGARIRLPAEVGPYRLFLYAWNDAGRAATANIPLLVEGRGRGQGSQAAR